MSKEEIPAGLGEDFVIGKAVEMDLDALRQHLYIVGKTGCGKSTLLFNLVMRFVQDGVGVCLLDPHGDLVGDVLRSIPEERCKDVLLVEPAKATCWSELVATSKLTKCNDSLTEVSGVTSKCTTQGRVKVYHPAGVGRLCGLGG